MTQDNEVDDLKAATQRIMAVMQAHKGELLNKPNVVGVAVGFRQKEGKSTQTLALVVMVDRKIPLELLTPDQQIPVTIEGVPIDVQEIGEITAY
jgi:hypothetical protein